MSNGNLFDRAVCLDVTFHKAGVRRKGDVGEIQTSADKDCLGLSKAIIDCKEYADVTAIATGFRRYCEKIALPSPLKRGTYLIPLELLDQVSAELDRAEAAFNEAADAFIDVYPDAKERARERLAEQYDEDNYPDPEKLREAFYVERRMLDFSPPGSDKVSAALRSRELERWKRDMRNAGNEIRAGLRVAAQELVGGLRNKLQALSSEGNKQRLTAAAVDNVSEFLNLFYSRDITQDDAMREVVGQAQAILEGTDVESLRSDESLRANVLSQMAGVVESLDRLVEECPKRAYAFED